MNSASFHGASGSSAGNCGKKRLTCALCSGCDARGLLDRLVVHPSPLPSVAGFALANRLGRAWLAVPVERSSGASTEISEWLVDAAPLAGSVFDSVDDLVIFALSAVESAMDSRCEQFEIFESVVAAVAVDVMDVESGRDWPVLHLPDPSVFELLEDASAAGLSPLPIPAAIGCAEGSASGSFCVGHRPEYAGRIVCTQGVLRPSPWRSSSATGQPSTQDHASTDSVPSGSAWPAAGRSRLSPPYTLPTLGAPPSKRDADATRRAPTRSQPGECESRVFGGHRPPGCGLRSPFPSRPHSVPDLCGALPLA